ncbi:ribonuclease H-like domain-containing protein [Solidesulfovibrio sp.]
MLNHTFLHLPGLGPSTERRLWDAGILTWDDFLCAPQPPLASGKAPLWRNELLASQERLAAGDADWFAARLPPAEAWRLFFDFRDHLGCVDIETDGTPQNEVTAVALYDGKNPARTYAHGKNLHDFTVDILTSKVLVTFNGRCFDAPILTSHLGARLPKAHIDLRNVLGGIGIKGGLKKCEEHFGVDRGELAGADGYLAVLLWREYSRHSHPAVLETLLAYNAADVLALPVLLAHAINQQLSRTPFAAAYSLAIPAPGANPHSPDPNVLRRVGHERRSGSGFGWKR